MTHPFRERGKDKTTARLVALTDKDLDDANRLLRLLAEGSEAGFDEIASKPISPQARARYELVQRRKRREHFPEGMFGETAWEILLLLYVQKDARRFTVTSLAEALDLPQNSTGRWLRFLHDAGFALRTPHRLDQRSIMAEISKEGADAIERYFAAIT